jgi:hypothetical protein
LASSPDEDLRNRAIEKMKQEQAHIERLKASGEMVADAAFFFRWHYPTEKKGVSSRMFHEAKYEYIANIRVLGYLRNAMDNNNAGAVANHLSEYVFRLKCANKYFQRGLDSAMLDAETNIALNVAGRPFRKVEYKGKIFIVQKDFAKYWEGEDGVLANLRRIKGQSIDFVEERIVKKPNVVSGNKEDVPRILRNKKYIQLDNLVHKDFVKIRRHYFMSQANSIEIPTHYSKYALVNVGKDILLDLGDFKYIILNEKKIRKYGDFSTIFAICNENGRRKLKEILRGEEKINCAVSINGKVTSTTYIRKDMKGCLIYERSAPLERKNYAKDYFSRLESLIKK